MKFLGYAFSRTAGPNAMSNAPLLYIEKFYFSGMRLSKIALTLLQGALRKRKHSEIVSESGEASEYVKNDVADKLSNLVSRIITEKITQSNLMVILHHFINKHDRHGQGEEKNQFDVKIARYDVKEISFEQTEQNQDINSTLQTGIIRYKYQEVIINKIIKNKNIRLVDKFKSIYHNLPSRDRNTLIGRETEITRLQELLSFESITPRISVEGLGGVGKTTLVLDVAYGYLQESKNSHPSFEAIVFTSAKPQHFTSKGILPRLWRERTLQDILRTIARTIKCPDATITNYKEAYEQVDRRLANIPTLLIIDNLDTLEDRQEVLSFLYELPPTVKVIITSRETTSFTKICLNTLTQTEGLALIKNQGIEKNIELTLDESIELYQTTGGIPAAIIYAVSQLATGYRFVDVSPKIMRHQGDFLRFYFENSMQSLKGHSSHLILMALGLFPKPALFESVCYVAGVNDNNIAIDAFAQLQQLSLISCKQGRYTMLSLTREYALSELATNPKFESAARNRWLNWYLDFAQKYGGKDEKEWNNYHQLEAEWDNICEVMEWCIAQDKYTDALLLWRYINCYTYSQGYRQNRLSYWDTPLNWLQWLIEAARKRVDLSTTAEMMSDYAWKLILIGQSQHLNLADSLLARAWKLNQHLTPNKQANLAIRIVVWYIQFKQFGFAKYWLKQAQNILNNSLIEESLSIRLYLQILYYKGEIYYKTGDYHRSQLLFQEIVQESRNIGWQRMIFLAKDFLADISIKQGKLQQAQQFLMEGMQTAQDNQDNCSRAYIMRSLARLEFDRGNLNSALAWARSAKEGFDGLGMISEAEETEALLQFGKS